MFQATPNGTTTANIYMLAITDYTSSALAFTLKLICAYLLGLITYGIFYLLCPQPPRSKAERTSPKADDRALALRQQDKSALILGMVKNRVQELEQDGTRGPLSGRIHVLEDEDEEYFNAMEQIQEAIEDLIEDVEDILEEAAARKAFGRFFEATAIVDDEDRRITEVD
ncbi:hypothetical protein P7C71_g2724, partial [Lecanoromycetidae sp. Uapishka_2]